MSAVLVTGGTGFLGRRLVGQLLNQGRKVSVLARRPAPDLSARGVTVIAGAVEDPQIVEQACRGVETVFHTAAKVGVWGRPADYFAVNVLGTQNVIEACRRCGVSKLVHTSTPSVVYNGRDLAGADESLPLTSSCPSPYPVTKARAEREVLAANGPNLRTVALRPHLIFGPGDPHLVPRLLARAKSGRLRIVGSGENRVDMVYIDNAVDAHLAAESAPAASGKAYFITNGEPVVLWDWINDLLKSLGLPPATRRTSLAAATLAGACCEAAWTLLRLQSEPPITRFVAAELARDHWFDISAARRDLGYVPRIGMVQGTHDLIQWLKNFP